MSRKKAETAAAKAKEVRAEPAKKAKPAAEMGTLMYVGPTIPAFAIQNQVYTGIPEAAKDIIVKSPELGNLFIEIRDYPKANRMLRERDGYIYRAYLKALELKK